ncbi:MAG TPA: hypothetical protein DCR07_02520, partial [Lactococcus sp.]|nr:hypothetical protein [Lactococcus sp.]
MGRQLSQRNTRSEWTQQPPNPTKSSKNRRTAAVFGTIKAPVAPRQSDYLEGQTPLWAREIS